MSIVNYGKGLAVVFSAAMLFACSSTGDNESTEVIDPNAGTEVVDPIVEPVGKSDEELAAEANEATRQARIVFFDLDDDTVSFEGRSLLEAHAFFLSKPENSGTMIVVEGHCDERGTPAYNLALGERRAKAVAQILMLNGVSASQIKTISHGEEKPADFGHDESAWSQNRRGVLVYEG